MKLRLAALLLLAAPFTGHAAALLSAAATPGTNTLTYTPSVTLGGTVNAYRAPGTCSASSVFTLIGTATAAGPFTDNSPLVGAQCYYVTALVNGVESVPSNKVSVTSTVLPQPPTNLVGTNN